MSQGRRRTVYMPLAMLGELRAEARRQNKPITRLVELAWKLSRRELRKLRPPTELAPVPSPRARRRKAER